MAFLDESGFMMAPVARQTWALRGHTPVSEQVKSSRKKVSVAAALWLPPRQDRLAWFSQTLVNAYYDSQAVALFVQSLLTEVGGRMVLVWDGGPMHHGGPIHQLLKVHAGRLSLELLPPYTPELNPVEPAWSWLKYGRLSNFAPRNLTHLHREVLVQLRYLHRHPQLLYSFFKASELPIPRTLLT